MRRMWIAALVVFGLTASGGSVAAKGNLALVEKELKRAIQKATSATVICVPFGIEKNAGSSSGVIVSRSGLVLSDGDAGAWYKSEGGKTTTNYEDDVEVRVANLAEGGFASYRARVVRRVRGVDTCLLEIEDPPPGGFPNHLTPFTSRFVQVADFAFVVGNAFELSREAPPTLTAGVVTSLMPLPADDGGGEHEFIYTTAAVNPGVNGGPMVDVEGRLIGTVSRWVDPLPGEPYQFLGKVVPVDRLRAVYSDLKEAGELFPPVTENKRRARRAAAMERAFRHIAREAHPAVVSLEIERKTPVYAKTIVQQRGGTRQVPIGRWQGPVSGVLVDDTGWIVTSLYNLTNLNELLVPWQASRMPPAMRFDAGLLAIQGITAHLTGGGKAPATVVAHDGRLGIALLKADLAKGEGTTAYEGRALETADASAFQAGRFVLALGNPFGAKQNADPLLAFGILSKEHAEDIGQPWRGHWQTDAGLTDANSGGALVDMHGRLLGILHLWNPIRHGRNSGIGFVVPWPRIAAALGRMKRGRNLERGRMGVSLEPATGGVRVKEVVKDSPAAQAGIQAGDVIVSIDGHATADVGSLQRRLAYRWAGEEVEVGFRRQGELESAAIVLMPRPASE